MLHRWKLLYALRPREMVRQLSKCTATVCPAKTAFIQLKYQGCVIQLHIFPVFLKNTLQLPLQSMHCCMQCVYNWDILHCHNILPWTLIRRWYCSCNIMIVLLQDHHCNNDRVRALLLGEKDRKNAHKGEVILSNTWLMCLPWSFPKPYQVVLLSKPYQKKKTENKWKKKLKMSLKIRQQCTIKLHTQSPGAKSCALHIDSFPMQTL